MKKLTLVMLLLAVGAGIAYASSLSVPWFVDQGPTAANFPPDRAIDGAPGKCQAGLVYLHNNNTDVITCSIEYYSATGIALGPAAPNNTFVIPASSTVAFRPVATDPASANGQESDVALKVPNSPMDNPIETSNGTKLAKGNGSLVVRWIGGSGAVQGLYQQAAYHMQPDSTIGKISYWGTLLPPGV